MGASSRVRPSFSPPSVPTQPVEIDWAHPLTNELVYYALPGSASLIDLVLKEPFVLGTSQSPVPTGEGIALNTPSGGIGGVNNISSRGLQSSSVYSAANGYNIQSPMTLAARLVPRATSGNVCSISQGGNQGCIELYGSGGYWGSNFNNNGSSTAATSSVAISTGVPTTVAHSSSNNYTHLLYVNGVNAPTSSDTTNIGTGTVNYDTIMIAGIKRNNSIDTSNYMIGDTLIVAVWTRGLSADEHARFSANPYELLRFTRRRPLKGRSVVVTNLSLVANNSSIASRKIGSGVKRSGTATTANVRKISTGAIRKAVSAATSSNARRTTLARASSATTVNPRELFISAVRTGAGSGTGLLTRLFSASRNLLATGATATLSVHANNVNRLGSNVIGSVASKAITRSNYGVAATQAIRAIATNLARYGINTTLTSFGRTIALLRPANATVAATVSNVKAHLLTLIATVASSSATIHAIALARLGTGGTATALARAMAVRRAGQGAAAGLAGRMVAMARTGQAGSNALLTRANALARIAVATTITTLTPAHARLLALLATSSAVAISIKTLSTAKLVNAAQNALFGRTMSATRLGSASAQATRTITSGIQRSGIALTTNIVTRNVKVARSAVATMSLFVSRNIFATKLGAAGATASFTRISSRAIGLLGVAVTTATVTRASPVSQLGYASTVALYAAIKARILNVLGSVAAGASNRSNIHVFHLNAASPTAFFARQILVIKFVAITANATIARATSTLKLGTAATLPVYTAIKARVLVFLATTAAIATNTKIMKVARLGFMLNSVALVRNLFLPRIGTASAQGGFAKSVILARLGAATTISAVNSIKLRSVKLLANAATAALSAKFVNTAKIAISVASVNASKIVQRLLLGNASGIASFARNFTQIAISSVSGIAQTTRAINTSMAAIGSTAVSLARSVQKSLTAVETIISTLFSLFHNRVVPVIPIRGRTIIASPLARAIVASPLARAIIASPLARIVAAVPLARLVAATMLNRTIGGNTMVPLSPTYVNDQDYFTFDFSPWYSSMTGTPTFHSTPNGFVFGAFTINVNLLEVAFTAPNTPGTYNVACTGTGISSVDGLTRTRTLEQSITVTL